MKKIKLDLSQINWTGMLVAGLAGFAQNFVTTVTAAQAQGVPQVEALKTGAVSGVSAAAAAVWGVFTQRTVSADGTASALPGLTSTHTNLTASDSETPDSPLPTALTPDLLEQLSSETLVQIATVLHNRSEARKQEQLAAEQAEQDKVKRAAELRAELAALEGATDKTETGTVSATDTGTVSATDTGNPVQ